MTEAETMQKLLKNLREDRAFVRSLNVYFERIRRGSFSEDAKALAYVDGLTLKLQEAQLLKPKCLEWENIDRLKWDMTFRVPLYANTNEEPVEVGALSLVSVESYKPGAGVVGWLPNAHGIEINGPNLGKALKHVGKEYITI